MNLQRLRKFKADIHPAYHSLKTLLRIDLTKKEVSFEEIDPKIARDYLGGKGIAAYYLFRELPAKIDPLSPENKLMIITGPLTGTSAPLPNRFTVASKSPLSNTWSDSHCGGWWGSELRYAGIDGMIIEGRAEEPTYIGIHDHDVTFKSAEFYWGMGTHDVSKYLIEKESRSRVARVLSVGPAGERLGLISNIQADERSAGRGGLGAVMGSKNLKAITVVGSGDAAVSDAEAFKSAVKRSLSKIIEDRVSMYNLRLEGTDAIAEEVNETGGWPTGNYQKGRFPAGVDILSGEAFKKEMWEDGRKSRPCHRCVISCTHFATVSKGKYTGITAKGPEYETIAMLGANNCIASREVVTAASYYADFYGIDTISLGNSIAFLTECHEKGLVSTEELDGVDLRFGDEDAFMEAVHAAGTVQGRLGRLVVNGVKRASEEIGKGSERFAMHVKGLEIPGYHPNAGIGQALAYAVADRGACHLRPWMYGREHLGETPRLNPRKYEDKPLAVKKGQEKMALIDSVNVCSFQTFAVSVYRDIYRMVNAATGAGYSEEEFRRVGERINNLTRAFNTREGFTSKDDILPWRMRHEPLDWGALKGQTVDLNRILPDYYKACGWSEEGVPFREKLSELGLDFVVHGMPDLPIRKE